MIESLAYCKARRFTGRLLLPLVFKAIHVKVERLMDLCLTEVLDKIAHHFRATQGGTVVVLAQCGARNL